MIVLLLVQVSFLSALPMHTPSASPSTFPLLLTALFGSLSNARASTLTCANRLLTEVKPLGPRWEVITYIEGAGMAQSGAVLILAPGKVWGMSRGMPGGSCGKLSLPYRLSGMWTGAFAAPD